MFKVNEHPYDGDSALDSAQKFSSSSVLNQSLLSDTSDQDITSTSNTAEIAQYVTICIVLAVILPLVIMFIITVIRNYRLAKLKASLPAAIANSNASSNRPTYGRSSNTNTRFRVMLSTRTNLSSSNRNPQSTAMSRSSWEFLPDPKGLVAIRNNVELAFPHLTTTSLRTKQALPIPTFMEEPSPALEWTYFEVEVISIDFSSNIVIGLATSSLPSSYMPGYRPLSVGYGSLDGQLYSEGSLARYSPDFKFGSDDTIGCGYSYHSRNVFFTKNGVKIATMPFPLNLPQEALIEENPLSEVSSVRNQMTYYPTVASLGTSIVNVNFGEKPFIYADATHMGWGLSNSHHTSSSTAERIADLLAYATDLPSPPPAYRPPTPVSTGSDSNVSQTRNSSASAGTSEVANSPNMPVESDIQANSTPTYQQDPDSNDNFNIASAFSLPPTTSGIMRRPSATPNPPFQIQA